MQFCLHSFRTFRNSKLSSWCRQGVQLCEHMIYENQQLKNPIFSSSHMNVTDNKSDCKLDWYLMCIGGGFKRQHTRVYGGKLFIWRLRIRCQGHPGLLFNCFTRNAFKSISQFQVGKVTATDADKGENADVTYSLLTEWGNEVFSLNPASGIFTLTSSLDYEKTEHYMFVVSGTGHGEPQLSSTVTVYINVKVLYLFPFIIFALIPL